MKSIIVLALLVLVIPLSGGFMAATPYLMPKRECFAVTVPESAQADPQIKAYKKRYACLMLAMTAVFTVAATLAAAPLAQAGYTDAEANALIFVVVLAAVIPTLVAFGLMLRFRRKVMALKRERGWFAPRQQTAALVGEEDVPGPISLAWNLLYIPVALFVVALGALWYPLMPDMIPMHADFAGNVNDYAPKGLGTLGFPVAMTLFLGGTFFVCHVIMVRSKRPTHPGAPVTSALAYGLFARAQSVFLLVCGLLLSLAIGVSFMASSAGFITLGGAAALIVMACVPVVVGSIVLAVVYGQAGSRLFQRMEARGVGVGADGSVDAAVVPMDDDARWKLGIFYFNPDDASVWLPERFGIGWTMNLARPAAWLFVVGFALLIVLFVAACVLMVG